MNDTILIVLSLGIAYLLGSIPFGYILVRTFRGDDIRATGSGNIGATNVARSGAKGLGIATLVLDALKGCAAVWVARMLIHSFPLQYKVAALAGLFAVLGHMFPVWLGFRGGKGVATALGVFLVFVPGMTLLAVLVFAVVVALTKYVSLGSIIGAAVLAILAVCTDGRHDPVVDLCYIAIALLVIWKHSGNIQRLRAGNESKFGQKSAATLP